MLQKHALHRKVIGSNRAAIAIEDRLTEMVGIRVDLSPASGLKERVAAQAAREAIVAF